MNNLNKKNYDKQTDQNAKDDCARKGHKLTVLLIIFDQACVLFAIISNLIQGYNLFYVSFTLLTIFSAIAALITAIYALSKGEKYISKGCKILSVISVVILVGILSFTLLIGGLYIAILMFM